jgi:hypothetical protein
MNFLQRAIFSTGLARAASKRNGTFANQSVELALSVVERHVISIDAPLFGEQIAGRRLFM